MEVNRHQTEIDIEVAIGQHNQRCSLIIDWLEQSEIKLSLGILGVEYGGGFKGNSIIMNAGA